MNYQWQAARHHDVEDIVALMVEYYQHEIESIFRPNPSRVRYHLFKILNDQIFGVNTEFIRIARNDGNHLIAISWLGRDSHTVYADEEMAVAEFIHVDLSLPTRTRVRLIQDILQNWIELCQERSIPILCSTTIRSDQSAFMRLHERMGFTVRGSVAYRRIM